MGEWFFYGLLAPFIGHSIIMVIDEFYFHRRRRLPLWEIVGHPCDSLTVLVCFAFISFNTFTWENLQIYGGLAAFSCIFVAKDEWIHRQHCSSGEMVLHAFLFTLHPLILISGAVVWHKRLLVDHLAEQHLRVLETLVRAQPSVIALFMIYQLIYGSGAWSRLKSIIGSMIPWGKNGTPPKMIRSRSCAPSQR